jgi:hypothetical protein
MCTDKYVLLVPQFGLVLFNVNLAPMLSFYLHAKVNKILAFIFTFLLHAFKYF